MAVADALGKRDLSHLAYHAGTEPQYGPDESLRKG
jgi:hypothetical protein